MDVPQSPVAFKRALSTRTYGRAFRQRTSFDGAVGASGSSGASVPSSAGAPPARRKVDDLSSSDDDAAEPLPQLKKSRRSAPSVGTGSTRSDVVQEKKAIPVSQAPTRASARRVASLRPSSLAEIAPTNAVASSSKVPAAASGHPTQPSNTAPKTKPSSARLSNPVEQALGSNTLANDPYPRPSKTTIKANKRCVGAGFDRKGKGRSSAAGMEMVLPEPRSSPAHFTCEPSAALIGGVKSVPALKSSEPGDSGGPAVNIDSKQTTAHASQTGAQSLPPARPFAAALTGRLPGPAQPKAHATIQQAAPLPPHSPKRIRLSSPPAHLKAQTPPGDILQQADYFSYPSPARNLFGVGRSAGPSSPLTPLSSSIAQSSPLRRALSPVSHDLVTPQAHSPTKAKPTALVPASPSGERTPSRSAANLSALFDKHVPSSSSSTISGRDNAKSVAHAQSPTAASSLSATHDSGGVDEEGGSLGKLVNLPAGRRRVDRLLQRSNTAPSLNLRESGSAGSGGRTPLGKQTISALFPSPGRPEKEVSTALWEIPVQPSASASQDRSPSSRSPIRASASQQGLAKRRTYGGSSRSMLAGPSMHDEAACGAGGERESYAKMAKRWGVDQGGSAVNEGGFVNDTIELTTITSLRARGENQSFLDDLGYLLDGLASDEIGVRRSSSVDLLRKMVAAEFRRNLKTYDQVESLWKLLLTARGQVSDIVLDASLVLFLALLARDGRALEPIFLQNGDRLSSLICRTMQAHEDADGFALERKSRHSKGKVKNRSLLNMMADLRKAWLEAELGGPEPSLRSAASSIFKHLVSEEGPKFDILNLLRKGGAVDVITRSLCGEMARLPMALTAAEAGQPLFSSTDPHFDFQHVHQCLVVLDNLLSRHPEDVAAIERTFGNLPNVLGALLTVTRAELSTSTSASSTTMTLCQISVLRMLLSLVTLAPNWAAAALEASSLLTTLARLIDSSRRSLKANQCQLDEPELEGFPGSSLLSAGPNPPPSSVLATSEAEGGADNPPEDNPATQLEILCLSLGLLSTFISTVDRTRDLVRNAKFALSCAESGSCVVACRCAGARSMLLVIVDLYEDQRRGSSAEASYLAGYAVLLLSLLMRSPENAAVILPELSLQQPNEAAGTAVVRSDVQRKLQLLASELEVFSDIHERFHDKLLSQATAVAAGAESVDLGLGLALDAESLKEIQTGFSALPSREAGVGAVREMISLLQSMAAAEVNRAA